MYEYVKTKNHYSWGSRGGSGGVLGPLGGVLRPWGELQKTPHTHRHQSCQSVYTRISASKRGMCKCGNSQGVYTRTSAPGICTCKLSMCVNMYPGQKRRVCNLGKPPKCVYTHLGCTTEVCVQLQSAMLPPTKTRTPPGDIEFRGSGHNEPCRGLRTALF